MKPYGDNNGESKLGSRAPSWWRAVVGSSLLVATAALYSGVVDARSGDTIWKGDDQSVVLAPQDEPDAPPNEHPVALQPEEIGSMLSGLRFRHSDQEEDTPPVAVFNREQVKVLGDALATGLSRATPLQDVTFSVVGAHRMAPGAFAMRNRLTAGRAFFRDGKLNVIFGDIQSPYRKKNIYGRLQEDFYPRKYGSRAASETQGSQLVASAGASPRDESGGPRQDWIVFPASGATSNAPVPVEPRKTQPEASEPRQMAPAEPPPEPAPAPDVAAEQLPGTAPATVSSRSDIEERLETLKRLREKDLISEEIYREKVDEVLEDL